MSESDAASRDAGEAFAALVALVARLRAPGGCPWDREQTHASLKPMAIEEAYELVEAIDEGRDDDLVGELGDLLLQVVFHGQIGAEEGRFTAADVASRVAEKMVRRHPHVFGDDGARTSGDVLRNWEALKAAERQAKGKTDGSMLDSVSKAHPAVMEALQITTKASRVGFDWKDAASVLAKLDEELAELRGALRSGADRAVADEVGRSPLRGREPRPQGGGRSGERLEGREPEVPTALRLRRGEAAREGPLPCRIEPR